MKGASVQLLRVSRRREYLRSHFAQSVTALTSQPAAQQPSNPARGRGTRSQQCHDDDDDDDGDDDGDDGDEKERAESFSSSSLHCHPNWKRQTTDRFQRARRHDQSASSRHCPPVVHCDAAFVLAMVLGRIIICKEKRR